MSMVASVEMEVLRVSFKVKAIWEDVVEIMEQLVNKMEAAFY